MFSLLAPAYAKKYGVDEDELKDVLTRIAWKNHNNGARNPRAQFRKEVAEGDHRLLAARRRPARHLRLLGRQRRLGGRDHRAGRGRAQVHRQAALREGAVVRRRPGRRPDRPRLRLHDLPRGRARRPTTPTPQAGITDPRAELAMAEVHDCFTPDRAGADGGPRLRRARHGVEGRARRHLRPRRRAAGQPRRRAQVVRPPDRRLGPAHAVRVLAAAARRGAASARSPASTAAASSALTHNLGGAPGECVTFVGVVGSEPSA